MLPCVVYVPQKRVDSIVFDFAPGAEERQRTSRTAGASGRSLDLCELLDANNGCNRTPRRSMT